MIRDVNPLWSRNPLASGSASVLGSHPPSNVPDTPTSASAAVPCAVTRRNPRLVYPLIPTPSNLAVAGSYARAEVAAPS